MPIQEWYADWVSRIGSVEEVFDRPTTLPGVGAAHPPCAGPHPAAVRAAGAPQRRRPSMRVLFLSWRDTTHPDGGGSEVYVEQVAAGLAARGHDVTLLCARSPWRARTCRCATGSASSGGVAGSPSTCTAWPTCSPEPAGVLTRWSTSSTGCPSPRRWCVDAGWWRWSTTSIASSGGSSTPGGWAGRLVRGVTGGAVALPAGPVRHRVRGQPPRPPRARVWTGSRWCATARPPGPAPRVPRSATPRLCVLSRLVPHKRIEQAVALVDAAARTPPRPGAGPHRRRLVGGRARRRDRPPRARRRGAATRPGRRADQGRPARTGVADGAAVGARGMGHRGARGGRGRYADRGLRRRRRYGRVGGRRPDRRAGRRRGVAAARGRRAARRPRRGWPRWAQAARERAATFTWEEASAGLEKVLGSVVEPRTGYSP